QQLRDGLMALDGVSGVRGKGLLLAAVLDDDLAAEVVAMALDNGLIVNAVRPNAVRWAPPLSITGSEIDDAVAIFEESLSAIRRDSDGH
ncbi:MAG: aminotransferase class III-fold pyridoxal phosphate-dependent enzyme, partial [Acidimicrobiia bacterium]|nr:aminotransferase class III-fold pyridoxal phosphate-dependent enzyme [Acidimicrobiia bacterium]